MSKTAKIVLIVFLVIAALIVAGIFTYGYIVKKQKQEITNQIDEMFEELKTNTKTALNMYTDYIDDENSIVSTVVDDVEMLTAAVSNLDYEIVDISGIINNYVVTLRISNKNIKQILEKFFSHVFENIFATLLGQEQDDIIQYFIDLCSSDEIENNTTEFKMVFTKKNGKWEIDYQKSLLRNIVLPGIQDYIGG